MNPMEGNMVKDSRKSERPNKGKAPLRYGFENFGKNTEETVQNQHELNVCGGGISSSENTLRQNISNRNVNSTEKSMLPQNEKRNSTNAKSVSKSIRSKWSRQSSIREIEFLKKTMERDTKIHEIEMMELVKKKEFMMRTQKLEKELKEKEDELSNNTDEDDMIPELDSEQRKKNTDEWVNKIENPFRFESMDSPTNNFRQREQIFESKSTRQNHAENSVRNDVLVAAFKALQNREIKDLPVFNGDNVLEWPNFISEFQRSTEEFEIKPNKNLRRLNKALEGNARTSVQTLLTSPDNIEEIISHLKMSFGRPEWILQHLVSELRSLPIMKDGNIHQFKTFYNKLFGAITTIRNMRQEAYLTNPELLGCLEEKLPTTTRNHWIHHKADLIRKRNSIDLRNLGEWFKYELDAQFAGLSAKDIINESHTTSDDDNYIPDGKEFP